MGRKRRGRSHSHRISGAEAVKKVTLRSWPHSDRGRILFGLVLAAVFAGGFATVDPIGAIITFTICAVMGPLAMRAASQRQYVEFTLVGLRRCDSTPANRITGASRIETVIPYGAMVSVEPKKRTMVRIGYHGAPLVGRVPVHLVMTLDVPDRPAFLRALEAKTGQVARGSAVVAVGGNQVRDRLAAAVMVIAPFVATIGMAGVVGFFAPRC